MVQTNILTDRRTLKMLDGNNIINGTTGKTKPFQRKGIVKIGILVKKKLAKNLQIK